MCFVIDGEDAAATSDGGTPSLLLLGGQSYAELECLLAVLREDGLVTDFTCVAVNARDMIAAIVLYLKRFCCVKCFAVTEEAFEHILVALE